jgi:hypothetical protein
MCESGNSDTKVLPNFTPTVTGFSQGALRVPNVLSLAHNKVEKEGFFGVFWAKMGVL